MKKGKFNKKPGKWRIFLFLVGAGVLFGGALAYEIVRSIPGVDKISDRSIIESTKIFDRTGSVLLYEVHGEEKRTIISFEQISGYVKRATLVAEDREFYKHIGLDGRGIARALLKDIRSGTISQGGSTITQQLVKNSLLTNERTLTRKIKEAVLAILVERKYSKDEILTMYLNQIPYGANAYGIEAASQTYFAKPALELTLSEAATLAAIPKATTYYSPYGSHKKELTDRKNWILERMEEDGYISKEEAETAKKSAVLFVPPKRGIRAPHFAFFVREYLDEKYGEDFVERGGLKVITTLDWELQAEAEKIVKEGAEQNEKVAGANNAALVAIDPKTGEILSMVGSRDYWEKPRPNNCESGKNCKFDPHVNVALRPRQPGSSFKPFVYATAFKKGYAPETVLFDAPTEFNASCNSDGTPGPLISDPGECYHPRNYDGKFRGPVSLRQSLAQSLNVPSVKLLYLAGVEESIATAREMGISTLADPQRYGLSLVLGGAEVTLLEMTSAYGAMAQDGILHPFSAVLRVETGRGEVLEEKKDVSLQVLDTRIARTMNDLLSDNDARVPIFSPQSSLYFPNRKVAAKTGTTQDYRDTWVIGYTPSLVAGVWAGNSDNSPMDKAAASVMVTGPIWHKFMEFALGRVPPEAFIPPDQYSPEKPALRGIYQSGPIVKIDKISGKLATENTPPELIEEKSYGEAKSILTFVKKDDPLGDPPSNPSLDPQFNNWQNSIIAWLAENPRINAAPPQDYDDIHTPDKRPKVQFISAPTAREPLKEIIVRVSSTYPLREASLFVNDTLTQSKTSPFSSPDIKFSLSDPLAKGEYQIRITAYDAMGNKEAMTQEFQVIQ